MASLTTRLVIQVFILNKLEILFAFGLFNIRSSGIAVCWKHVPNGETPT